MTLETNKVLIITGGSEESELLSKSDERAEKKI